MSTLGQLLDAMARLRVLVIGEAMLDSYLEGSAQRLCPEAPVPVVDIFHRRDVPGGAANTAVNVAGLGGQVTFLSVVGNDWEGTRLRQALASRGVSPNFLLSGPSRQTLAKQRVLAGSQMLVRFDQGSTQPLDSETEQALIDQLIHHLPNCDAVIVSDYAYGILTPAMIEAIASARKNIALARGNIARSPAPTPCILAVDSRHLGNYRHLGVTVTKPNYREAVALLETEALMQSCARPAQIAASSSRLLELTGAQIVAVTLDTEGSLIIEPERPLYRTQAQPQPQAQTAGAGDTFISAFTLALAAGGDVPVAADLATAAAAVVVSQPGTVACDLQALRQYCSVAPSEYHYCTRLEESKHG